MCVCVLDHYNIYLHKRHSGLDMVFPIAHKSVSSRASVLEWWRLRKWGLVEDEDMECVTMGGHTGLRDWTVPVEMNHRRGPWCWLWASLLHGFLFCESVCHKDVPELRRCWSTLLNSRTGSWVSLCTLYSSHPGCFVSMAQSGLSQNMHYSWIMNI